MPHCFVGSYDAVATSSYKCVRTAGDDHHAGHRNIEACCCLLLVDRLSILVESECRQFSQLLPVAPHCPNVKTLYDANVGVSITAVVSFWLLLIDCLSHVIEGECWCHHMAVDCSLLLFIDPSSY